jgi:predicted transcriptional regulator of viral defense system
MTAHSDRDREVAALAAQQYGVVRREQLRGCGLNRQTIAHRVGRRRLIVLYDGVYAVGHAQLRMEGRWLAAVFAGGPRAVLSHGDAAAAWGLAPVMGTRIDVSTPARSGRTPKRPVRLHRVATLRPEETTVHDGIPITTVARTLVDQAPRVRGRALEQLIAQADRRGRFDLTEVRQVLSAHPRQSGRRRLGGLLDRLEGVGTADLRSPAEVAMAQLCDDHGLPAPVANVEIAGFTVDFHWPGTDLVAETDGFTYHNMPTAFESDRERDQVLMLAGWRVVRFTFRQLTREPERCAARLGALLHRFGSL